MLYTVFDDFTTDFEELKKRNNEVVRVLRNDWLLSHDVADKIAECGSFLGFHIGANENGEVGKPQLVAANFCRQKLCPTCQKRKSLKMFANTLKVCEYLERYEVKYIHLVLTVPNCRGGEALVGTIKKLYRDFGKFYHYKETARVFKGCLRCLEITYNAENSTFHPHLHCLIAVNKSYFNSRYYLTYDRLRGLWQSACRSDKPYQISVGAIRGDVAKGVAEVCKYCVKPLDLDEVGEAHAQYVYSTLGTVLKGQRAVQKYGLIKEAYKALDLKDEDEDEAATPPPAGQVLYFRYNKDTGKYRSVEK